MPWRRRRVDVDVDDVNVVYRAGIGQIRVML
jgi:hypothetical protein